MLLQHLLADRSKFTQDLSLGGIVSGFVFIAIAGITSNGILAVLAQLPVRNDIGVTCR
jgi:hypothetical protein